VREDFERIVGLFTAMDSLLERVEPTWWGAVVSDRRFPAIWDVNYARVERSLPDLRLGEVEEALLPVLAETGALNEEIVLYHSDGMERLLDEASRRGDEVHWDTTMSFTGSLPGTVPAHPVEELVEPGDAFWAAERTAFVEFDVKGDDALDQMVAWERSVLFPSGMKRWFVVREHGAFVGFGAFVLAGDVGYVDNVVTPPEHRRRGIAAAVVARVVREAQAAGARHLYLLADDPGAIRIYERLGFSKVGAIASIFRRLGPTSPPPG
jgi:ribosomal protein S18 acetylase RimI-like enzyme